MPTRVHRILRLFCPDQVAESVTRLDVAALRRRQMEALLMDLDNTLVRWRGYEVPEEVLAWLRGAEAQGLKLCIVSNTRFPGRLSGMAQKLGLPFISGVLKPRRGAFREALKLLNVEPCRAAVVGDQVLTDILGGNRLGLHTILVRPMSRREFAGTRITRLFERVILRVLRKLDMLPASQIEHPVRREQSSNGDSQKNTEQ